MYVAEFLTNHIVAVIIFHVVSVAFGMGTSTVSDLLYLRFIKDGKISPNETSTIHALDLIRWSSISILVITEILIFLSNPVDLMVNNSFLIEMLLVVTITLNAFLMTEYFIPHLTRINFTNPCNRVAKRVAFASAGISVASWYLTFFFGMINFPFDLFTAIVGVGTIMVIAVLISQLLFAHYQNKFTPRA